MNQTAFTHLGFGLGFRPTHYERILNERPNSLEWLEVITENFMDIGGRPRLVLEQALEHYPIALHGVGLSIGSPHPPRNSYLKGLKDLTAWVKPVLVSDHLSFSTFEKHNSHDLLPIPYTQELLDRIVNRIHLVQDLLGRRFMLENPSAYVSFARQDFSEVDFMCELVSRTGCGVLLDVNNLFVNQMNLGLNPIQYIDTLPAGCVGQIHLAGHSVQATELGTVRIDTHDHPINDDVWSLHQVAVKKFPEASVMIEWDDHIPELSVLLDGLEKARVIRQATLREHSPTFPSEQALIQIYSSIDSSSSDLTSSRQQNIFSLAIDSKGIEESDQRLLTLDSNSPVSALLGARVYNNAYFSRLCEVLRSDCPTLSAVMTDEAFQAVAASYFEHSPPWEESVNGLARLLGDHLATHEIQGFDFGVPNGVLADIARFDWARSQAFIHTCSRDGLPLSALQEITDAQWDTVKFVVSPTATLLDLSMNPIPLWESIQGSTDLEIPTIEPCSILVWRQDLKSRHMFMSNTHVALIEGCQEGLSFKTIVESYERTRKEESTERETVSPLVSALVTLFENEMITDILST